MKAKSRKRLLISSVAMLLVAMLALGTATFAWFTTDTTTKASQVSVVTDKKSTLLLSKTTGAWTDDLKYNFIDKTLQPTSSNDGINWYAAVADSKTAFGSTENTAGSKVVFTGEDANDDSYLFHEMINVHNAGTQDLKNVKFTVKISENTAVDGKNYLRWAIVPAQATKQSERDTKNLPASASAFTSNIFAVDTTAYKPVDHLEVYTPATTNSETGEEVTPATYDGDKSTVAGKVTEGTSVSPKAGIGLPSGYAYNVTTGDEVLKANTNADGGDDEKYYMIYIWFEGQDSDCFDTNSGNAMPDIEITATGDPVTE